METGNDTNDLVAQIEADEASRRSTSSAAPRGPSLLGRPGVVAASFVLFAVSASWGYVQSKEPFPAPVTTAADAAESARYLVVRARDAVEAYRAETGTLPDDIAAAVGEAQATLLGYVRLDDEYVVGTMVGDELVWIEPGDDVARFLQDGARVPATAAPAPAQP